MTLRTASTARLADDAGLSLLEVIIYMLVSAVFLGLVGTIFITTIQANASSVNRDLSAGRAQVVSTSLSASVRNAADIEVQSSGTIARAVVARGTSGWECRAWAFHEGNVRMTTYATLASGTSAPTPSSSWGVLSDGVTGTFSENGSRLTWNLTVRAHLADNAGDGDASASVAGSAVAGARAQGSVPRCW